ncbi:MAG: class E sortase, partial [Clostridia bacterium]|nr:class E sortase [Clostridia bacterium]
LLPRPAGGPATELTPEPSILVSSNAPLPPPAVTPAPAREETPPPEADLLPAGKLVITKERAAYSDGGLTLRVPALDLKRTIWNGTAADVLSRGVGLYEYAQLPGEGNCNVSLAGHRNGVDKNGRITDHAPFYYVDTLKEGDYLYLSDSGHVYRYLYASTEVVEPDDWSPIYVTEGSYLTITSCTPIGVSDHRIVVRSALDGIFDFRSDFDYLPARASQKSEQPES